MRFKHFLAIFGFTIIAAAYSTPGAYERLLYYYAYKLDKMGGGKTIASGCSGSGGVCSFDEFVHFIEGRDASEAIVKITPEEFPPIEATVKLLVQAGKTGEIVESRIISNANNYPELFRKLGTNLSGILQKKQGFNHKTLSGEALENKLQEIRQNIVLSMKRVFDGRVRATFDKFKPYDKFKVVTDGDKAIDFDATIEKNKGSITKEKLQELWEEHLNGRPVTEELVASFKPLADYTPTVKENAEGQIDLKETFANAVTENPWMKGSWFKTKYQQGVRGNHQENVKELKTALESIEPLVCVNPEARKRQVGRLARRQSSNACFAWETPELKEIVDLPPATEGSEGVTNPESLLPGEGAVTGRFVERATRANQVSVEEFEKAIGERLNKVPDSWVKKGVKTFNEVRQRLGYKPLEPTSPDLIPGRGGKASGALGKLGGAVGGVLWVKGIIQSFLTDSTALDKAAAWTAIIPFIGCAVNTAAAAEKPGDNVDLIAIDVILCGIADVLLFGPLAPFGYALHFVRAVMSFFQRPPKPPTLEEMKEKRDESWAETLKRVYASVYSHSYVDPTQSFAAKLESAFTIDTISVLSEAAERIGALNASGSPDLYDPSPDLELDLEELESGTRQAISNIQLDRWDVVARRQREFLLSIPEGFANGTAFSLTELAKAVNDKFIEHINGESFLKNYRDQSPADDAWDAWGGDPILKPIDHYSKARAQMKEVGSHLSDSLPPLPQALNVAFVLGQSKGMKFAQRETLDPYSYFDMEITEASTEGIPGLYRFYTLVRHTHQTALFLQGRLKEEEFDNSIFPVDNLDLLKGLRLLVAMKLGKIYEDKKIEDLDYKFRTNPYILSPTAPPLIINPYIPPVEVLDSPDNAYLVSLAIGLIGAVSDKDLTDEVTQYLQTKTSQIRLKNWEAMQKKIKTMQTAVMKIAKKQYTGPPSPEEFLSKHMNTCVDRGMSQESCKYIVGGCYYADDTSDEFASECIGDPFQSMDEVRRKMQTKHHEVCSKFPGHRECGRAMATCARANPRSRIQVLWACATKAAPKPDEPDVAATPESTS